MEYCNYPPTQLEENFRKNIPYVNNILIVSLALYYIRNRVGPGHKEDESFSDYLISEFFPEDIPYDLEACIRRALRDSDIDALMSAYAHWKPHFQQTRRRYLYDRYISLKKQKEYYAIEWIEEDIQLRQNNRAIDAFLSAVLK